ncbi:MAG: oxygen-independent coproporphyrinogen III oxidase [Bdellovibrionales bacterium]
MSCTLKQKILDMDARVPRYTSYPTAPHFKAAKDAEIYRGWLQSIPAESGISLYIHIPFCPKLCWYCGCNTKITKRYDPVRAYVDLLLREIDILAAQIGRRQTVSSIHFGGGSPGMLEPCDFARIMNSIRSVFEIDADAEIAIELDPRNVTEGRVAAYAKHGVNRVSLGVQDFDDKVMASVNRQQPFQLSYNAARLLRDYGIAGLNIDLIYGLPHQNADTMRAAIDKALLLSPDRIAFFGYAHVPWMKKHMRLIDEGALPDKDLRYDLFQIGSHALIEAGYMPIGIDHFAKAGDSLCAAAQNGTLHRNFQGYTTDACETLIGLGVSSIGQMPQGYTQNAPDLPGYKAAIESGVLPVKKYCPTGDEDRLRAGVIARLMCDFRVDVYEQCRKFGFDDAHLDADLARLQTYETLGFITIDGGVVTVTPQARLMVRSICAVFDSYLTAQDATPRHAQAV